MGVGEMGVGEMGLTHISIMVATRSLVHDLLNPIWLYTVVHSLNHCLALFEASKHGRIVHNMMSS